jgi:hypothetical protein
MTAKAAPNQSARGDAIGGLPQILRGSISARGSRPDGHRAACNRPHAPVIFASGSVGGTPGAELFSRKIASQKKPFWKAKMSEIIVLPIESTANT